MLHKLGVESVVTADPGRVEDAGKIILCGIGSFDEGMTRLESMGLVEVLRKKVMEEKIPILGVCLGMQLFTRGSEEGQKPGLGFVPGYSRKFDFTRLSTPATLRIPHMGWNTVRAVKDAGLNQGLPEYPRFYFVHSYHVVLDENADELFQTDYGYPFTAAFEKDNIIGVQFHPEKSHRFGIRLYENFVKHY
jgi:glutamine amidotransferase